METLTPLKYSPYTDFQKFLCLIDFYYKIQFAFILTYISYNMQSLQYWISWEGIA